jgi:hypothetical protein
LDFFSRYWFLALLLLLEAIDLMTHSIKQKRCSNEKVYQYHRVTIYCSAIFDAKKNIEVPDGFVTTTHLKRAEKVKWEHVHL